MNEFISAVAMLSFALAGSAPAEDLRNFLPCRMALAPHEGSAASDEQIRGAQDRARDAATPAAQVEQLGWLFVAKAREGHDDGFYSLAAQCASCITSIAPDRVDALLLQGHVEQSLHRFKNAEAIARDLVARRGGPFDYGLLGDALMDQGQVAGAVDAYQRMVDLKPGLQSYARAAHARWMLGDIDGAIEAADLASAAASPRDPVSAAWVYTRLAQYLFQAGRTDEASAALDHALEFQPGNSQAHWLKGRMFLAAGRNDEAAAELRLAERAEPLPEIQWALADALHAAGREIEAKAVEAKLVAHGATSDPRSFALYLATRGVDTSRAVELARREIELRQDVFTKDALAWALYADGRIDEAARLQAEALAAGTRDARMYGHAAAIFRAAGRTDDGRSAAAEAERLRHMLLPSETQHNQQGG